MYPDPGFARIKGVPVHTGAHTQDPIILADLKRPPTRLRIRPEIFDFHSDLGLNQNIRHVTHRPAHNDSERFLPEFDDDPKLLICEISQPRLNIPGQKRPEFKTMRATDCENIGPNGPYNLQAHPERWTASPSFSGVWGPFGADWTPDTNHVGSDLESSIGVDVP